MPLVAYGHAGQTLLMFPTAAADYLEYERFHLVDAIEPLIEAGKIRAYSINSVNRYSLLNDQMPPNLKAELLTRFDRYIIDWGIIDGLARIPKWMGKSFQPLTNGVLQSYAVSMAGGVGFVAILILFMPKLLSWLGGGGAG